MIDCTRFSPQVRRVSQQKTICRLSRGTSVKFRRISLESRMAKTILLIIGMYFPFLFDLLLGYSVLSFILACFTVSWTPYAIVAFISSFLSPTLISPLAGTLPGMRVCCAIAFAR